MSLEENSTFYYQHFPTEAIFLPEMILSHGVSEEVYEEVIQSCAVS